MTVLQGMNTLIPYLTIPLVISKIGIEGYGLLGVAIASIQYIQLVVDHGYTLNASRQIAQNKQNSLTSEIFWNLFYSKLLLFVCCSTFVELTGYLIKIDKTTLDLVRIGYLIVIGQLLTPTWLYIGKERGSSLLILSLFPKILVIPFILLLINDPSELKLAMLLQSVSSFLTGIITFYLPIKNNWISYQNPEIKKMITYYKNAWPLFVSAAAGTLYSSSTPIILNITSGPHFVGIFIAADKIRQAAQSALTPISLVVYPKINNAIAENKETALILITRIGGCLITFSGVISLFIFSFSAQLLQFIYSPDLIEAKNSLQILSFAVLVTYANTVLGTYIFIPFGIDSIFSKITLFSGVFHIFILFGLCNSLDSNGAAASVLTSELIMLFLMITKLTQIDTNREFCGFKISIMGRIFIK